MTYLDTHDVWKTQPVIVGPFKVLSNGNRFAAPHSERELVGAFPGQLPDGPRGASRGSRLSGDVDIHAGS